MAIVFMNHETGQIFVRFNGFDHLVRTLEEGCELSRAFNRQVRLDFERNSILVSGVRVNY